MGFSITFKKTKPQTTPAATMMSYPLFFKELCLFTVLISLAWGNWVWAQEGTWQKRHGYLEELKLLNRPHPTPSQRPRNVEASFVRLSAKDSTWEAWQQRTGELPPDFSQMPDLPFLPDPLVWDEGGQSLRISNVSQWHAQRQYLQEQVKLLFSGTFPDAPASHQPIIKREWQENGVNIQRVEIRFGEHEYAKLNLELMVPPGNGPFPVFLTQWNHRGWAQLAVRRGYIGVIYAGADEYDDTIHYQEVYPDYDWTALMTRAWGASRAVDYLYTLQYVDKKRIALTGHSRNGKLSLLAGAFDPRFTAIISSSAGTGGEIPYRYTDERHENESLDYLNSIRPQWFHPRLRFFNGREHKLPIDQNSLMALIAPNALLLSSSIREGGGGDPWAIEQTFQSLKPVYAFHGASNALGVRFRDGGHSVAARDLESYLDWLDIQFERSLQTWENTLYYPYSFEDWKTKQKNLLLPENFKEIEEGIPSTMVNIPSQKQWGAIRDEIRNTLNILLGTPPPGISAAPPGELTARTDYLDQLLERPAPKNGIRKNIAPYRAMGDYQYAALYLPANPNGQVATPPSGKFPVVIWSHKYSNTGFDRSLEGLFTEMLAAGFAVLVFDQLGYGSRIEEGTRFYDRYPHWSKMGKMVADTQAAIDALHQLADIDTNQIFLAGHSLGGTISLLSAALDHRIAGVAVCSAFTPWRAYDTSKSYEGIKAFSHLYGLIPNLGLFLGQERRIPVDFPEILASIAPKPLLIINPSLDRHADAQEVRTTVSHANRIYSSFGNSRIDFSEPKEFGRFSQSQQKYLVSWLSSQLK